MSSQLIKSKPDLPQPTFIILMVAKQTKIHKKQQKCLQNRKKKHKTTESVKNNKN